MTTAKYISKFDGSISPDDYKCTERTVQVDLAGIKDHAKGLLGAGLSLAWAYKFSCHGLRLKASDSVSFKGTKMTAEEFREKIRSKANFCTEEQIKDKSAAGLGIDCDKRSVTASRLVRSHAADVSHLISKGLPIPEELSKLADAAGLKKKYGFLDSAYGMDDKALAENAVAMYKFCTLFDDEISAAYKAGHIKSKSGDDKHSHAKSFANYAKWRGVEIGED